MATDVILQRWDADSRDGSLLEWLASEGESVIEGESLARIRSGNVESEVVAPVAGIVAHIMVAQGTIVEVGALLAVIADPSETVPRPSIVPPKSDTESNMMDGVGTKCHEIKNDLPGSVDVEAVQGIDGIADAGDPVYGTTFESEKLKIVGESVSVPDLVPMTRMRKAIATRMMRSVQSMAQVTLTTEADVTEMVCLREQLVREWRPHRMRPVDLDFVVRATAVSLREHPRMNATLEDGGLRVLKCVNLGVAVSLDDGLVVPVIKEADSKDLVSLAKQLRSAASRSRNGRLSVDDLTGATFTITSLAGFDIDAFTPIIDPPQVGILGVGRVSEKPAFHEGQITVRSMMSINLTFDHRALDGVPAGEFLKTVKDKIEDPHWMLSHGDG